MAISSDAATAADVSGATVRERAVRVTIDRAALRHNLEQVRRRVPDARTFAVVKADAYGHGAIEVARALDAADGLAVVTVAEAQALRSAGEQRPILVMQGVREPTDAATCAALSLWPAVHHASQLDAIGSAAAGRLDAWLKIDTGMGRLGVLPDEVSTLLARDEVAWRGVMTHLACADEPESAHAREQIAAFARLVDETGSEGDAALDISLGNSAAAIAWPLADRMPPRQWVRPGLMLYCCNPLDGVALPDDVTLAPAMTVTAPLISIKTLPAGAGVGYAQSWRCPERMSVGYAAIGYADGLPRVLSGDADVQVGGVRCPIVGRVSMDSIAIDLRPAERATSPRIGDPVTLWGDGQPVERLAAAAGTIAYELLTGIRGRRDWV